MEKESEKLKINCIGALIASLIIIELVFFFAIQFDFFGYGRIISFAAVSVCLIYAFIFSIIRRKFSITAAAMVFTLVSDVFFVLLEDYISKYLLAALFTFLICQTLYFIYTIKLSDSKREAVLNIVLRVIIIAALEIITAICTKENYNFTVFVGVFYFSILIGNTMFALAHIKTKTLFALGMLLFLFCDIVIALDLARIYAGLTTDAIISILFGPVNLIWLFYVPSQTLLSISIIKDNFLSPYALLAPSQA